MFRANWKDRSLLKVRGVAAVVLVLLLGVRFGLPYFMRSQPAVFDDGHGKKATTSATIVVLPFAVGDGPNAQFLNDSLATLLTIRIDGAGDLSRVDPQAVASFADIAAGPLDSEKGRQVAAHFNTTLYVLGSARESDRDVHLEAAFYDAAVGPRAVSNARVDGRLTNLAGLIDDLANQLVSQRVSGFRVKVARLSIVTSESLSALQSFFAGERHLLAARFAEARAAFAAAVSDDPQFALAHYHRALAAMWDNAGAESSEALYQALLLSNRLPNHDRQLVEAHLEELRGTPEEAERRYRSITTAAPDDWQAWLALSDVLRKLNRDGGEPLQHALALLPSHPELLRRDAVGR